MAMVEYHFMNYNHCKMIATHKADKLHFMVGGEI